MLATLGFGYWDDWALQSKLTFDGENRWITVNTGVTTLDIRSDLWTDYMDWYALRDNSRYGEAIRFIGLDPIPNGQAGDMYFLQNGWKLILDLAAVRITGILFSDDYETAYYDHNLMAVYPAQVSALVNTVTTIQNVVTGDISSVPSASDNANAVWTHTTANTLSNNIGFIKGIEGGRWKIVNNQMIFYNDDNITELARFDLTDSSGNPTNTNVFERTRV